MHMHFIYIYLFIYLFINTAYPHPFLSQGCQDRDPYKETKNIRHSYTKKAFPNMWNQTKSHQERQLNTLFWSGYNSKLQS